MLNDEASPAAEHTRKPGPNRQLKRMYLVRRLSLFGGLFLVVLGEAIQAGQRWQGLPEPPFTTLMILVGIALLWVFVFAAWMTLRMRWPGSRAQRAARWTRKQVATGWRWARVGRRWVAAEVRRLRGRGGEPAAEPDLPTVAGGPVVADVETDPRLWMRPGAGEDGGEDPEGEDFVLVVPTEILPPESKRTD